MSDTPLTARAKIACGFQAVPQSFLEHAEKLELENAELRIYKERLDWLIQFGGATFYKRLPHSLSEAYIAIDTRRKEDPSGRR